MSKKIMTLNKAIMRAAFATLLLAMPILLSGCGKSEIFEGGADYPYTVEQKTNGKLVVTLNGSKTPGHVWECELVTTTLVQADEEGNPADPLITEPPVTVKQKGKEKNGKAKFVVKPREENGNYRIAFIRKNPQSQEQDGEATEAAAEGEEFSFAQELMRQSEQREDVSDEISVVVSVERNNNGKLLTKVGQIEVTEMTGIVNLAADTPYPCNYQVNREQVFELRIPNFNDLSIRLDNADGEGEKIEGGSDQTEQTDVTEQEREITAGAGDLIVEEQAAGKESGGEYDYSDIDDPQLLAELKALDEQIANEEGRDYASDEMLARYGMLASGEEGEDDAWYKDPDLHIWKKDISYNEDQSEMRLQLQAMTSGWCRLTLESEATGRKLSFLLRSFGNSIRVWEATCEGGEQAVEGAVYDSTQPDAHQTDEEFLAAGQADGSLDQRKAELEEEKKTGTTEAERLKAIEAAEAEAQKAEQEESKSETNTETTTDAAAQ